MNTFDLLLPPPLPFLPSNRAFDSRSAPTSKYYQPSIIYPACEPPEHEKNDWALQPAPTKERWSSDITNNQSNTFYQRSPEYRTLIRSGDNSAHQSPLSSHTEEDEDLSCEFDNLTIDTAGFEREISCDQTYYERVPYRPNRSPNPYQLHHEQPRSEPSIQHSIASHHSGLLSAHIHPFDGPSSLIYSTSSPHGRLVGSPDQLSRHISATKESSNGLFIETDSSHSHELQDCYAETASLSTSSFSNQSSTSYHSWAASPCQSPTSPFFDSSVGGQDPILSAGLDIFASQLQSARLRISAMAPVQESEDQ